MKKTLSLVAALSLMSVVVFAGGIDDPKTSSKIAVVKKDKDHVKLIYKGSKKGNVEVAFYNDKNELQFTETIYKVEGFVRPYDLSSLKNGDYTLVVKDQSDRMEEVVHVSESIPVLLAHVIRINEKEGKFALTVVDKSTSYVDLKIVDQNNQVVYESQDKMDGQMMKLFKIKGSSDNLTFQITDHSGNSQTIKL